MNLLFPQKVGYILTSCNTGSFSRWTLLRKIGWASFGAHPASYPVCAGDYAHGQ